MFGMSPLKALAMQPFMPFQKDDTCLMYLSEFDFTNQHPFPYAWLRPYSTWASLPGFSIASPGQPNAFWRQVSDVSIAASTEWWRARDFIRQIAFLCGPSPKRKWRAQTRQPNWRKCQGQDSIFGRRKNGLKSLRGGWKQKVLLCIFEGDVNPALYSPDRLRAKAETASIWKNCHRAAIVLYPLTNRIWN